MNWLLITIIWIGPGYITEGVEYQTESECMDAAFEAAGEAQCYRLK